MQSGHQRPGKRVQNTTDPKAVRILPSFRFRYGRDWIVNATLANSSTNSSLTMNRLREKTSWIFASVCRTPRGDGPCMSDNTGTAQRVCTA